MSWNVVQATLRQVSCKLSDFLMLLASSCVATMIMFAYQVVSLTLSEERESVMDVLMWMGWVYSPVLLFLYVLSSAAAVTEKVDRLVPLVNSWSFDDRAVLDESRQYVVQYILHSRAGFYARGIRILESTPHDPAGWFPIYIYIYIYYHIYINIYTPNVALLLPQGTPKPKGTALRVQGSNPKVEEVGFFGLGFVWFWVCLVWGLFGLGFGFFLV